MQQISCVVPTKRPRLSNTKVCFIILAGNPGYRMRSFGPKSLFKIGENQNIFEYYHNTIYSLYNDAEIILVTGFESDKVIKNTPKDIKIVENQLYETTGEMEQVRLALNNNTRDKVFIINSGVMFNKEVIKINNNEEPFIIVDSKKKLPRESLGVTSIRNMASIISYGLPLKWSEIIYLNDEMLEMFQKIANIKAKNHYMLFEGINRLLNKKRIKVLEPKGMQIAKIYNSKSLREINENIDK